MNRAHLYELEQVGIHGPFGPVLQGLDWSVRPGAVTVLLGPAGTGKSALLRGMTGRPFPLGWRLSGSWRYKGRDLRSSSGLHLALGEIAWLPQVRACSAAGAAGDRPRRPRWREAFGEGNCTILLDEPTRGLPPGEIADLVERVRGQCATGAAVVVTHDLAFARVIADDVCLVCAGRIVAQGKARCFFDSPPNELAERFLSQGNCWPARPWPPELPSHFRWVLPGKLAGMGRPGLLADLETDLESIAAAGAGLVVSLTEEPLASERLRPFGLTGRHFPIQDMGVPAIGPAANLCREIERAMKDGAVVVHCHAGLGRTGTILAAVLVWLGRRPDEAVDEVRGVARGYIQNRAQLDFVHRFGEAVRPPARGA
jgi:atypical dual specificity phosphatase